MYCRALRDRAGGGGGMICIRMEAAHQGTVIFIFFEKIKRAHKSIGVKPNLRHFYDKL
jgi:hypothetical protein